VLHPHCLDLSSPSNFTICISKPISDLENKYSYHVLNDELRQFNHTVSAMNQTAQYWAQWDDTYSFVAGKNPSFVTNNLPPPHIYKA